MKTLLILSSMLVLVVGCASNKNKNAGAAGAPPAPVTTETGQSSGQSKGFVTGYTTEPQPGQTANHGWYTIQLPAQ